MTTAFTTLDQVITVAGLTETERALIATAINAQPGGQRPVADHANVGSFVAIFVGQSLTAFRAELTDAGQAIVDPIITRLAAWHETHGHDAHGRCEA